MPPDDWLARPRCNSTEIALELDADDALFDVRSWIASHSICIPTLSNKLHKIMPCRLELIVTISAEGAGKFRRFWDLEAVFRQNFPYPGGRLGKFRQIWSPVGPRIPTKIVEVRIMVLGVLTRVLMWLK